MENSKARRIAFYGVLSAIMFVFLLIETYLFKIFFGNFTPAILTLPFAVALSLFKGKGKMWMGGLIFGACSFFLAVCIGNPIFLNPLISIFPRIFIGVVAYFVYFILERLLKNAKNNYLKEDLPVSIAGVFGILANTVLTLTMMWAFNSAELASVLTVILSVNFLGEVIGAFILVPVYKKVLKRVEKKL